MGVIVGNQIMCFIVYSLQTKQTTTTTKLVFPKHQVQVLPGGNKTIEKDRWNRNLIWSLKIFPQKKLAFETWPSPTDSLQCEDLFVSLYSLRKSSLPNVL